MFEFSMNVQGDEKRITVRRRKSQTSTDITIGTLTDVVTVWLDEQERRELVHILSFEYGPAAMEGSTPE